ncbi:hypothetical protein S7711_08128 [Stachybotrys chartarum IBT 7711]|uniref:3CxxC-type domain-containing protein n=1 Tax=Stachybotrys chartarum (strain CBS 109288 / IBT 7711) TaxID=1280523 RepID=A0A084AVP2_STACB|nr:hypothetical protein S7711_08128 [Stachybotrys chartarum IBT 7711]KFA45603.1 hypothetical protein S40293_08624 [Stachybotrys chartarum IBT 40293]KFA81074.1 hypothetical protein S40288_00992 [Stachybotrys chartarum IBT 40288]
MTGKRSRPAKQKSLPKTSSLFPSLHDQVSALLQEYHLTYAFHPHDDATCLKERDTNIMGRFVCRNPSCSSNGWSSKMIPVTIRLYRDNKYNARVYHQRCRKCNHVSRPTLDHSYAERVAYWLETWAGADIPRQPYTGNNDQPPHESHLCEGCRVGRCQRGRMQNVG